MSAVVSETSAGFGSLVDPKWPRASVTDEKPATIAVYSLPNAPLDPTMYLVRELARFWKDWGIAVVDVRAPVFVPSATLAIMHVDATEPNPAYQQVAAMYPRCLNANVGSIAKRSISRNLVVRGDEYDGPVVVKTNANFGGVREYKSVRQKWGPQAWMRGARERLHWTLRTSLPNKDYHIFDHASDVPRAVWWNRDLVVEKLLCERAGDAYVLRSWTFFGSQGFVSVNTATTPIVHGRTILTRTLEIDQPVELVARRDELGFDFAKFDYTIIDGSAHLLDANSTATVGNIIKWPWVPAQLRRLASSIEDFLPLSGRALSECRAARATS